MQRYRYTGPDESRDLALPGGVITFPRMEWVDPEKAADESGIPAYHLTIALRGLGDDWQAEGPVKAAKTRKAKKNEPATTAVTVATGAQVTTYQSREAATEPTTPAEPDEEQS